MDHFASLPGMGLHPMQILDQLPDAVILLDQSGRIAYWNRKADRMFRLAERRAKDKRPDEVGLDLWGDEEDPSRIPEAASRPEGRTGHVLQRESALAECWLEVSLAGVVGEDGSTAGTVATIRDVTGHRHRLRDRDARIETLRRAVSRLAFLETLIPLCSHCKRARNEQGDWLEIETFLSQRLPAKFSHGICPSCAHVLHPECFHEPETPRRDDPASGRCGTRPEGLQ